MFFQNEGIIFSYDSKENKIIFDDTKFYRCKLCGDSSKIIVGKNTIDVVVKLDKHRLSQTMHTDDVARYVIRPRMSLPLSDLFICDKKGSLIHLHVFNDDLNVQYFKQGVLEDKYAVHLNGIHSYFSDSCLIYQSNWKFIDDNFYALAHRFSVDDNYIFICSGVTIQIKTVKGQIYDILCERI